MHLVIFNSLRHSWRTRVDTGWVLQKFRNSFETYSPPLKQFTAQYTPQQNGISERKNRTIMEMASSMLVAKHFPSEYWGEAVATAVYIMNRCMTKSVKNKVPQKHGQV